MFNLFVPVPYLHHFDTQNTFRDAFAQRTLGTMWWLVHIHFAVRGNLHESSFEGAGVAAQ